MTAAARFDIQDRADIERLVTTFYESAFEDDLLGPIFVDIAKLDLPAHLPIMCDFWETVLFRAGLYHRNALAVHFALNRRAPLGQEHFDRWLQLWKAAVSSLFVGPKADFAGLQATRIAGSIHRRLDGESGSEFVTIHSRRQA